jgi:hypothetical protein
MAEATHPAGGSTEVFPVWSAADLQRFIRYPFARHRDDPNWAPPLLLAEKEQFESEQPLYEHARVEPFLARGEGEVVGRVAAVDDDNHKLYERAIAKGYKRCECSWTLEDNRPMNHVIGAGGARRYKTYRIYQDI